MEYSDIEILEKLKRGDLKTYESLFKEYYSILCNYANKYIKKMDISEEIVQELFYKIWKNKEQMNISVSLKAYLFKSIQNNCLQYIQHEGVEQKYEKYFKKTVNGFTYEDPLDILKTKEMYETIVQTMKKMPARTRKIFRLSRFDGLKYKEIAEKLSISVKTVEANMGVALKSFRRSLKEYTS